MASVLPPLVDLPFGDSAFMRSSSFCADDACTVVRRHVLGNQSPASFGTASSLPCGVIGSQKENSPLSGSASSLLNFKVFDSFHATTPPRRSWSWTVPGENLPSSGRAFLSPSPEPEPDPDEAIESQSNASDDPDLTALHVANPDTGPKTPEHAVYQLDGEALRSGSLPDIAEESGSDTAPTMLHHSPCSDTDTGADDDRDHDEPAAQGSPFKRWLRALKKKSVPHVDLVTESEKRWVLDDDFAGDPNQYARRHMSSQPSRHRKTPSSVSSVALIAAVKSASVTMASLSLYPRSRRSMQTSNPRREPSSLNATPARRSFDGAMDLTAPMDDGTWARSIQRQRIVEEIISSEESYIRDMQTLINVVTMTPLLYCFVLLNVPSRCILQFYQRTETTARPYMSLWCRYYSYTRI
jgi:hypothetical protein